MKFKNNLWRYWARIFIMVLCEMLGTGIKYAVRQTKR